jgi:hypothetical protein
MEKEDGSQAQDCLGGESNATTGFAAKLFWDFQVEALKTLQL